MGISLMQIAFKMMKGELPPISPEELSAARMNECTDCMHYRKMIKQCNLCGCLLPLKTKILEASCPIDKW